jgi:hypothetical protein
MGKIKFCLCFKKKQAKKSIFAPKIAPRVERSHLARNSYFPATFWVPACSVVSFSTTEEILNRYMGEGGERGIDRAQTISLNCGVTHSRGKIEYNCRYFIMTFCTQIHPKNSVKNVFVLYRVLCPTARWPIPQV